MTPDLCFDEMALALGLPEDTGYIVILESVKKLTLACLSANSGLDDLREARDKRDLEIKELTKCLSDRFKYNAKLKEENGDLMARNKKLEAGSKKISKWNSMAVVRVKELEAELELRDGFVEVA